MSVLYKASRCSHETSETRGKMEQCHNDWLDLHRKGKKLSLLKGEGRPCYCILGESSMCRCWLYAAIPQLQISPLEWMVCTRAENHPRKMADWGRSGGSVEAPVRSALTNCCPDLQRAANLCEAKSERLPKLLATSIIFPPPSDPETFSQLLSNYLKKGNKAVQNAEQMLKVFSACQMWMLESFWEKRHSKNVTKKTGTKIKGLYYD